LTLAGSEALGVEGLPASGQAVEHAEELAHDGDLGFGSGLALLELPVVVGPGEHRLSENGEDRLSEDLAQKRPSFFREPGLAAIAAALPLAQIESGIPEQSSSGTEVRKWAGLACQASEIKERDPLRVAQVR